MRSSRSRRAWWLAAWCTLSCADDGGLPDGGARDASADGGATGGVPSGGGRTSTGGNRPGNGGAGSASTIDGSADGSTGGARTSRDAGAPDARADAAKDCGAADAATFGAEIATYCGAAVASGCSRTLDAPTCERALSVRMGRVPACCHDAFARLVSCGAAHGLRCATLSDDILFTPECAVAEEEWNRCSGNGDNCTEKVTSYFSDGGASCRVECNQYAAICAIDGMGAKLCDCVFGPHTGQPFLSRSCDAQTVADNCK